jgi:hypothetical protein
MPLYIFLTTRKKAAEYKKQQYCFHKVGIKVGFLQQTKNHLNIPNLEIFSDVFYKDDF